MSDSNKKVHDQQFKEPHGATDGGKLQDVTDKAKAAFAAHTANPGPVVPENFNAQELGTKEERAAKAKELNKDN
ncbi:hypothetical protein QBC37DRAFT_429699 [Rhypophila decipiens]|uniref:Uncharacterized protein n=1 Tax=Rhypophila decipiens TaxID=261697 RepID=A0AAN7B3T8_9PEZI|nr:hypothetical protein QBC37DRAFT_429699 [Rhypophila decipiens]